MRICWSEHWLFRWLTNAAHTTGEPPGKTAARKIAPMPLKFFGVGSWPPASWVVVYSAEAPPHIGFGNYVALDNFACPTRCNPFMSHSRVQSIHFASQPRWDRRP